MLPIDPEALDKREKWLAEAGELLDGLVELVNSSIEKPWGINDLLREIVKNHGSRLVGAPTTDNWSGMSVDEDLATIRKIAEEREIGGGWRGYHGELVSLRRRLSELYAELSRRSEQKLEEDLARKAAVQALDQMYKAFWQELRLCAIGVISFANGRRPEDRRSTGAFGDHDESEWAPPVP